MHTRSQCIFLLCFSVFVCSNSWAGISYNTPSGTLSVVGATNQEIEADENRSDNLYNGLTAIVLNAIHVGTPEASLETQSQTIASVDLKNIANSITILVTNRDGNGIVNNNGVAIRAYNSSAVDISLLNGRIVGNSVSSDDSGTISILAPKQIANDNSARIVLDNNTLVSNNNSNGGNAILFNRDINLDGSTSLYTGGSKLKITSYGTINVADNVLSNAIVFLDLTNSSTLEINNKNTGIIYAGRNGTAIFVGGSNLAQITNYGQIIGKIILGSREDSFITVDNNGLVDGDLTFGNSNQILTLNNGGALSGKIIGSGIVNIGTGSFLRLNGSNLESINVVLNGTSSGGGSVFINSGQSVKFNSAIGAAHSLANFNIETDATAALLDDLSVDNVDLSGTLDLQKLSGNIINGNINGSGTGSLILNSASHVVNGNINLSSGDTISVNILDTTLAGNITASGLANIADGVKLKVSASDLNNIGSSYKIVSGASGSAINPIVTSNINVAGTGTNKVGIFEFNTLVVDNSLILNATRLDDSTIGAIAKNVGQPNPANSVFNNANSSLNILSSRLVSLKGISSGEIVKNKNIWGQTFTSNAKQEDSASANGYGAKSIGLIFGSDYQFENDITAGFSIGYSNSNIKSNNRLKKTDIDSYQFNLYGSYDFDKYFVNGLAGIIFNKYSSLRAVVDNNSIARADYSGKTYIARIEGGTNYALVNDFNLTPILSLTAAKNEVENYSETGAGIFGVNVKNDSVNFIESRAGFELSKKFDLSRENKIRPKIFSSYGYDFVGDKQNATLNFIGQSESFDSRNGNVARESLKIGTGVELYYGNSLKFNLDYGFEKKAKYQANSGSLKAKYSF